MSFRWADNILFAINELAGGNPQKWIDSITHVPGNKGCIVSSAGSYSSFIKINGMRKLPADVMETLVVELKQEISEIFSKGGYITFDFENDPNKGIDQIKLSTNKMRVAAKDYGLNMDDIIDGREDILKKYISYQTVRVGIYTPGILLGQDKNSIKNGMDLMFEERKKAGKLSGFINGRIDIIDVHKGFVNKFIDCCNNNHVDAELMESRDILTELRNILFKNITHKTWKVSLLGDAIRKITQKKSTNQSDLIKSLLLPSIPEQVLPGDFEVNNSIIKCGHVYFKVLSMKISASEIEPFSRLHQLIGKSIPYRVRVRMAGNGLASINEVGLMVAQMLRGVNDKNYQVYAAKKALNEWKKETHGIVTDTRFLITTWSTDITELKINAEKITHAVTGWGRGTARPEVTDKVARPVRALIRMLPGASAKPEGYVIPAPMSEAIWMNPLSRPGSIYESGPLIMRHEDGKIHPIELQTSMQTARVVIAIAPMRMGKSVLLNSATASHELIPGMNGLANILVVDSGWGSLGTILLLQNSVPKERKYLFQHHRITMNNPEQFSYNIFQTPLGIRTPTSIHRDFILRMLAIFCRSLIDNSISGAVSGMLEGMVDHYFQKNSMVEHPKQYNRGSSPEIDKHFVENNIEAPQTWWECCDLLFKDGHIQLAELAHRKASFTLIEFSLCYADAVVNSLYTKTKVKETDELVPDYIFRCLNEAAQAFPLLANETTFSCEGVKVMALDLSEVTKTSDNPKDLRQAAAMYMLARQMGASQFYEKTEDYDRYDEIQLPDMYRLHVMTRVKSIEKSLKTIVYDEFHRTGGHIGIVDQIINDVREGPKYNVGVWLFSQRVVDYPDTLCALATTKIVLGIGVGDEELVQKKFKLTDATMKTIKNGIKKPNKDGSYVFIKQDTSRGDTEALLRFTTSPIELWALTTTPRDVQILKAMYERFEGSLARRKLAKAYPSGSAESEIEKRIDLLINNESDDKSTPLMIIDDIINEISAVEL